MQITFLQLMLITLKLMGVLSVAWFWVFLPFTIQLWFLANCEE